MSLAFSKSRFLALSLSHSLSQVTELLHPLHAFLLLEVEDVVAGRQLARCSSGFSAENAFAGNGASARESQLLQGHFHVVSHSKISFRDFF